MEYILGDEIADLVLPYSDFEIGSYRWLTTPVPRIATQELKDQSDFDVVGCWLERYFEEYGILPRYFPVDDVRIRTAINAADPADVCQLRS